MSEPLWLGRIVDDLRECSVELLAPGLATPSRSPKSAAGSAPVRASIAVSSLFCGQLPALLSELETESGLSATEFVTSRTPSGARASLMPSDYASIGGQLRPVRWLRPEPRPESRLDGIRWLLGLAEELAQQIKAHAERLGKQIDGARFVRSGESHFAEVDRAALDAMQFEVLRVSQKIAQAIALLRRTAGRPIARHAVMPYPFPRGAAWSSCRRLAERILNPRVDLPSWVGELLATPIAVADVPFLYQRWCGLQILNAARRAGWDAIGDVIGALFLGGVIQVVCEHGHWELWVEPRLGREQSERVGWSSDQRGAELTPDFLLVSGVPGNRAGFVLDATLSTKSDVHLEKAKYLESLVGTDALSVAGINVPIRRRPERSWAMAPIDTLACRLGDPFGKTGVIPMSPASGDFRSLDAWMGDFLPTAITFSPSPCALKA